MSAGRLPYPKAALASFTALSLGHNIGLAALSSGAVRYRFYSRWGLSTGEVAKVIVFCGVTVGLGLLILGGAALLLRSGLAVEITGLTQPVVIALGLGCLAVPAIYLILSALRAQAAADPALVARDAAVPARHRAGPDRIDQFRLRGGLPSSGARGGGGRGLSRRGLGLCDRQRDGAGQPRARRPRGDRERRHVPSAAEAT